MLHYWPTRWRGLIGQASASCVGGLGLKHRLSQTKDLKKLVLVATVPGAWHYEDWSAQCQNNVTEWCIGSWDQWHGILVGQHYKVVMTEQSQVGIRIEMNIEVART